MSSTSVAKLKRPMATVRRVGLFSREIVERLSLAGVEMLLDRAAKLSEGQVVGQTRYYGSTMLTLDLREVEGQIKDSCDVATAMHLARMWSQDAVVIERVKAIARAAAAQHAGQRVCGSEVDVRVRAEGSWIFIDTDIEASVALDDHQSGAVAPLAAASDHR